MHTSAARGEPRRTTRHESRRAGAFTLVEILMVIVTITLLAGLMVPRLEDSLGMSRDARRKADLKSLVLAMESYRRDQGAYPDTGGVWRGDAPNFGQGQTMETA